MYEKWRSIKESLIVTLMLELPFNLNILSKENWNNLSTKIHLFC